MYDRLQFRKTLKVIRQGIFDSQAETGHLTSLLKHLSNVSGVDERTKHEILQIKAYLDHADELTENAISTIENLSIRLSRPENVQPSKNYRPRRIRK